MKRLMFKMLLLTLVVFVPASAMARVSVHINIPLPPPIIFPAPPELVVIPETDVYAVPDVEEDIFFQGGWWWRPWDGHWYRSRYYDRGWTYYPNSPYFHRNIPSQWRDNYRNQRWQGYRWERRAIPHQELQRNWNGWKKDRRWEKQGWGVQGWNKRPAQKYRYDGRKVKPQPGYRQEQQRREEHYVPGVRSQSGHRQEQQRPEEHYVPGVGPVPGPSHRR